MQDGAKLTYTIHEMAQVLGVGLNKAYQLAHTPDFPAVQVGKTYIIPKKALEQWLLKQAEKTN